MLEFKIFLTPKELKYFVNFGNPDTNVPHTIKVVSICHDGETYVLFYEEIMGG